MAKYSGACSKRPCVLGKMVWPYSISFLPCQISLNHVAKPQLSVNSNFEGFFKIGLDGNSTTPFYTHVEIGSSFVPLSCGILIKEIFRRDPSVLAGDTPADACSLNNEELTVLVATSRRQIPTQSACLYEWEVALFLFFIAVVCSVKRPYGSFRLGLLEG